MDNHDIFIEDSEATAEKEIEDTEKGTAAESVSGNIDEDSEAEENEVEVEAKPEKVSPEETVEAEMKEETTTFL